jgi:hypothetical protein
MIKSRPNHRNSFRRLFLESLQDRRLMAIDLATPLIDAADHCDMAEAEATNTLVEAAADSRISRFQSQAEAIESLKQMAVEQWSAMFGRQWDQYMLLNADLSATIVGDDFAMRTIAIPGLNVLATDGNFQTAAVNEADNAVFSNDGYVFVFRDQAIRIIDIRDPKDLKEVSRIELTEVSAAMHLVGNKLVVISEGYEAPSARSRFLPTTHTRLKFFDVSDREAPVNEGGFRIEGSVNISRIVDGKLVLVQETREALSQPQFIDTGVGAFTVRYETKQEYLDRVTPTLIDSLLVNYQRIGADGKVDSEGVLGDWRDIAIAGGKQLTSIVTIDLNTESPTLDSMESILGGWVTNAYVTENSIYLTHLESEGVTRITQLDLANDPSGPDSANQQGVAAVAFVDLKGTIRDSRFMDEYDGYLRVVTSEDGSNSGGRIRNSANVFVLKLVEGELKTIGSLLDISPGDQAYSAEFEGPRVFVTTGFVEPATFRLIDPLHGIDLSDPANPKELSDVVIPGITNYVQWVDSNHLLGVGMVEEQSQWFTQVSLYDVTDIANPKTLDAWRGATPIQPNFFGTINALDIHYHAQSKTLTIPQAPSQFFPGNWGTPWWIDRIMPIWNPNGSQEMPAKDIVVLAVDVDAVDPVSLRAEIGDGSGMGRAIVVGDTLVALTSMYLATYSMEAPTLVVDRILLSNPLRPDSVYITGGAQKTIINVLENDSRLTDYKITAIKRGVLNGLHLGTVEILPDQTLEYTIPASAGNESWWDNFTYEVTTVDGKKFETQVSLWVDRQNVVDVVQGSATISAKAVDRENKPVTAIAKGDEFWVEILVQDGRPNGQGVFGAYLNLAFDTDSFEIVGDAEPLGFYANGLAGEKSDGGWKNLGGFSNSRLPIGSATQSLVRFKLRATETADFKMSISTGDPHLTLYGINETIPIANITWGSLQLPMRVNPSASIGLKAYDAENKPVTSTAKGDEFWVEVTLQDDRPSGQGVYSAYVDLAFDTNSFEVVGESEALGSFTNKLLGVKSNEGWKNLGGFRDSVIPTGSGSQSLVRFKLRATEDAVLNMTVSPSSQAGSELTLYGIDTIIPLENIESSSLQLPITKVAEKVWDFDVNADGIVSPIDSLIVINRLNRESVDAAFSTPVAASSTSDKMDVNQDGIISLLDVLTLVNRINRDSAVPMMNTVDSNDITKKK